MLEKFKLDSTFYSDQIQFYTLAPGESGAGTLERKFGAHERSDGPVCLQARARKREREKANNCENFARLIRSEASPLGRALARSLAGRKCPLAARGGRRLAEPMGQL